MNPPPACTRLAKAGSTANSVAIVEEIQGRNGPEQQGDAGTRLAAAATGRA